MESKIKGDCSKRSRKQDVSERGGQQQDNLDSDLEEVSNKDSQTEEPERR